MLIPYLLVLIPYLLVLIPLVLISPSKSAENCVIGEDVAEGHRDSSMEGHTVGQTDGGMDI